MADLEFCTLVRELDDRVAAVDGHGFTLTPFVRADDLSDTLGFSPAGGIWIKDETRNVSGSHKARHLFGVLIWLEVAERLGLSKGRPDLAIASCGNAALAAAVVAAAGERALHVFVPTLVDPSVVERLERLGAQMTFCPRERGVPGDSTVRRLHEALAAGALPFTCQGDLNGLAVEGGHTLGWELAASGVELDRLVVQVGGGALASGCIRGLEEAVALGALPTMPRVDTVQTESAWPLKRAFERVVESGDLEYAARHRSEFMWPWEEEPRSIARGILDDETYDWLAVVEGMLATGGRPLVVDEERLGAANALALETTGIAVDPTGSAGLAALLALRAAGEIGHDARVGVLFTGIDRTKEEPR
jgi:threonine synthase